MDTERRGAPALAAVMFGLGALSLVGVAFQARKAWNAAPVDATVAIGVGVRERWSRSREARRQQFALAARMRTTTAIVAGVNPSLDCPVELVLGRYSERGGTLGVAAVVPVDDPDDVETLTGLLGAPPADHPWRPTRSGAGRTPRADPRFRVDCVTVNPDIVVEIRVDPDTLSRSGRWQHAELVKLRHDLAPDRVPRGKQLTAQDHPTPR
ncbi:hypothetical protein [Embleya scabrispora]|uniref:hypothetical protein n=1 Tax=Embleya scabrispora TaxID=159449 RepID=UPI00117BF085|nr:hypothetical protein [Embleya scabrispora]